MCLSLKIDQSLAAGSSLVLALLFILAVKQLLTAAYRKTSGLQGEILPLSVGAVAEFSSTRVIIEMSAVEE